MHQPSDAILSRLVEWCTRHINVARKTRFQNQTSIALGIIALLVEIVHREFSAVHHADKVDVKDLQVRFDRLLTVI
jgi:hypothetical protein